MVLMIFNVTLPVLFVLALLIAYWFDYKKSKKDYGENGQTQWYLYIIAFILLLLIYSIIK